MDKIELLIRVGTIHTQVYLSNEVSPRQAQEFFDDLAVRVRAKMGVLTPGAENTKQYRIGVWDGITPYYDTKDHKFMTGLIHQFLEVIREMQEYHAVTYTIEDERPPGIISSDQLSEEIILGNGEGEDILLRDYQYSSVKEIIDKGVGIVNVSTGGGKCVTRDTHVLTSEGYKTVEQIFEENGTPCEAGEHVVTANDIQLVNRYGELESPSHLTFNGLREVNRIKTSYGIELTQTMNHPLLTLTPTGEHLWKDAGEIVEGGILVSRKGTNVFGTEDLVDEDEAYRLGEWGGREVIEDGDEDAQEISPYIMKSPRNVQLAYIAGYFERTGFIDLDTLTMEVASTSRKLTQQLRLLLRNLDILSTTQEREATILAIDSKDIGKFIDMLPFRIPEGKNLASMSRNIFEEDPTDDKEYMYEEVESVEVLEEEIPTFDFHMPETNSFIAESIINHNTEIASGAIQQLAPHLKDGERIAFFTDSREIFHQTAERFSKRLDMPKEDIGMFGDGIKEIEGKQLVMVMIPTVISSLESPSKGLTFTPKERMLRYISEKVTPQFKSSTNTQMLLRGYIENNPDKTNVWRDSEAELTRLAYSHDFTDKTARMALNEYTVKFQKVLEKKNKTKLVAYLQATELLESVRVMIVDECVTGDTDILLATGDLKKAKDVQVGDELLGGKVTELFNPIAEKIYEIVTDKGIIRVTGTHSTPRVEYNEETSKVYLQDTPAVLLGVGDYIPHRYLLGKEEHTARVRPHGVWELTADQVYILTQSREGVDLTFGVGENEDGEYYYILPRGDNDNEKDDFRNELDRQLDKLRFTEPESCATMKTAKILQVNIIANEDPDKLMYDFTTESHTYVANGFYTNNCHHTKSDTWIRTFQACPNAQIRAGLTGTIDTNDGILMQNLTGIFHQVITRISNKFLIESGYTSRPKILLVPVNEPKGLEDIKAPNRQRGSLYREVYKQGIVSNIARNKTIANFVKGYIDSQPGGCLMTVNIIEHGENIIKELEDLDIDVEFLHGELDKDVRDDRLARFANGELRVLVSTTVIDEGVDVNSIGCLILTAGGKSLRQTLQRIGRGLRLNDFGNGTVTVVDFVDYTHGILLNHSKSRIAIYDDEGFEKRFIGRS